ncbi:MAG: hypothetical protein JGK01_17085, partial [Microcoleus sp. PH2017_03_ELD_O_A]|nr:hypothetical protein [Microcoleus sp. PH2017_03_ELD_O_A]
IALMFVWGFSKRTPEALETVESLAESAEVAVNLPDAEVKVPEAQAQKSEI